MSNIESRLAEMGITLPEATAPAANYIPFVQVGDTLYVSGQISMKDGEMIKGKVGDALT
ncbi:MAG: RidA family protein, partial [Pseudooceanicola nanhaiensis]